MKKTLKVIEWNINQRSNYSKAKDIPYFVLDELKKQNADIIVLTEFFKVDNWIEFCNSLNDYNTFVTDNSKHSQNEVLIAIKKDIRIKLVSDIPTTSSNNNPNFLRVDIEYMDTILSIIGIRIRTGNSQYKYTQMEYAMEYINTINNPTIVAGDFNNNRRETIDKIWSIDTLDKLFDNKFIRYTPDGSSIYKEKSQSFGYEFAIDHFFLKEIDSIKVSYDRNFVYKAPNIYVWDKDFQIYYGNDKYEAIPAPFPDHALLIGELQYND